MILRLQFSTLLSDRPTQARSGARMRTSPDVGECDLERVCEGVDTVSSDNGGNLWGVSLFPPSCCRADAKFDMEVSVLLRVLVSTVPDSVVMSSPVSSVDKESSVETGDRTGEIILDARRFG